MSCREQNGLFEFCVKLHTMDRNKSTYCNKRHQIQRFNRNEDGYGGFERKRQINDRLYFGAEHELRNHINT